ncbi:MAG: hypothetical protein P8010_02645 [Desulfosarcinaceae bacterium]
MTTIQTNESSDRYRKLTTPWVRTTGAPPTITVSKKNADCAATGLVTPYVCPHCQGQGWVRDRQRFMISVPPKIEDGTSASLDLDDVGLGGVRLHLYIRVAADPMF